MGSKPFHLAWFLQGSSAQAWGQAWTGHIGATWMQPELFLSMARSLERGKASIIDAERRFVVGSVNVVPFAESTHAGRRFETRDGRRILEVIDVVYQRPPGAILL